MQRVKLAGYAFRILKLLSFETTTRITHTITGWNSTATLDSKQLREFFPEDPITSRSSARPMDQASLTVVPAAVVAVLDNHPGSDYCCISRARRFAEAEALGEVVAAHTVRTVVGSVAAQAFGTADIDFDRSAAAMAVETFAGRTRDEQRSLGRSCSVAAEPALNPDGQRSRAVADWTADNSHLVEVRYEVGSPSVLAEVVVIRELDTGQRSLSEDSERKERLPSGFSAAALSSMATSMGPWTSAPSARVGALVPYLPGPPSSLFYRPRSGAEAVHLQSGDCLRKFRHSSRDYSQCFASPYTTSWPNLNQTPGREIPGKLVCIWPGPSISGELLPHTCSDPSALSYLARDC